MPGSFLNSSQEAVRYKNRKNVGEEERHEELLISSSLNKNKSSERERRCFPRLNIYFYLFSTFVTVLILSLALSVLYFRTSVFKDSQRGLCVPLHQVEEVIVVSERTHFPSCTDNKTCHYFLDIIENEHDGSKYNFVIGQRGELYIGTGFKCLINSSKNTLYVKLLRSEQLDSFDEYLKMCIRLSEIIDHGILCEKISPHFKIQDKQTCGVLESNKNRSYHVHDPNHDTKLIHSDFGWSFCGGLPTSKNMKQDKVITLESLPKNSCSPLQLVDEVIVDIVDTQLRCLTRLTSYSDHSQCLQEYEELEGFKYNFIISYNLDIYVGSGFKCTANSTSNTTLRIKVLLLGLVEFPIGWENQPQFNEFIRLLKEGFACGRISENFTTKVNCNTQYLDCSEFKSDEFVSWVSDYMKSFNKHTHLRKYYYSKTALEDRRHYIVPKTIGYQFCCFEFLHEPTILINKPTHPSTDCPVTASNTSCVKFRKVDTVRLVTEKTNYLCPKNEVCPLLDSRDVLKFNFVIGPEGELYIGAGFKCIANSKENVLYVKLIVSEGSVSGTFNTTSKNSSLNAVCSRLSELIEHGILCEKISLEYDTVNEFSHRGNNAKTSSLDQSGHQTCMLGDKTYKNRSNHLHDPDYKMHSLIDKDTKWTFCGDFSNKTRMEVFDEPTQNILNACSPLDYIDEIIVTAESNISTETCPISSEARQYNFFIGDQNVCIGAGFNCEAVNTTRANNLRVAMSLNQFGKLCEDVNTLKENSLLHILEGVVACHKIGFYTVIKLICHELPESSHVWSVRIQKYSFDETYISFNNDTSALSEQYEGFFKLNFTSIPTCPDTSRPGLLPLAREEPEPEGELEYEYPDSPEYVYQDIKDDEDENYVSNDYY